MAMFSNETLEEELDLGENEVLDGTSEEGEFVEGEYDGEGEEGEYDDEYEDEEYDEEEPTGKLPKKALIGIIGGCAAVFLCVALFMGTRGGKGPAVGNDTNAASDMYKMGSVTDMIGTDPGCLYEPGDLDNLFNAH